MTNSPNGNFPNSGIPGMVPGASGMPTQPAQPAQPAQPTQPVQPGQAAQPTQPTQPTRPAVPGHSTVPGQAMPAQAMPMRQQTPGQQQTMPSQTMPAQATPAQAMPGQMMPAQYSSAQAFPGGYAQPQKAKNKKVIIGIVSAVSVVVLVIVGVLVWAALTGAFTATPSEKEVEQGLEQIYDEYFNTPSEVKNFAEEMGVDEKDLQKHFDKSGPQFAQCVTDEVYGHISKDTKIALSKGNRTVSTEDERTVENAASGCYYDLVNEYDFTAGVPSKEDYRKGMEMIYEVELNSQEIVDTFIEIGMPEDVARAFLNQAGGTYAQCMTDTTYDAVSDETRRYIARGTEGYATAEDKQKISDNVGPCMDKAFNEFKEKNQ